MNTDQMDQTQPPGEQQRIVPEATASGPSAARTRRHLITTALGGAGALALAASGALALQRAAAKDDDDSGDDDSGGDDNSGSGGGDDHDDDHSGGGDDDDSGRGRGRGRGGDDDDDDPDDHQDADDDDDRVDPGNAGVSTGGVIEVRITDDDADAFSPQSITVDIGAEVTFVNDDDDDHTATGAGFDTGVLAPGESATVTLDEAGEQFYSCLIHPEMTGTIIVRDPSGRAPGATPAATPRVIEGTAIGASGETVTISNFAFEPDALTVATGTTVTWENADDAPHTATAEDGTFDTDRINTGGSASVTFDEPGTFAYVCLFHPNMLATITVE